MWFVIALMCYSTNPVTSQVQCGLYVKDPRLYYDSSDECMADLAPYRDALVEGAKMHHVFIRSLKIGCAQEGRES